MDANREAEGVPGSDACAFAWIRGSPFQSAPCWRSAFSPFIVLVFPPARGKNSIMTPVDPPSLQVERNCNLVVVVSLIAGVALVFAFFLVMLFMGIGTSAQIHRVPVERQLPTIVPD